ncbi:Voltage-dependent calcium channel subunit alpha-2/delta-1 [Paragonimus heterotremus]|uniref:Voltage-dependent calcium channel subunit alpha-2/delta-1 n=1 Tax=Paragonimus heterotremus TaxID=100268 RepID=A0A8J4SK84_9TREM|nr:Voltage-dependent calcium channel subunit alpha-2/delta-1 [Paragonimus heterotremus]
MGVVFLAVFLLLQLGSVQLVGKASTNLFSLKAQVWDFLRNSGKLIEFVQLYQRKISSGPFRLRNFDAQVELREYVTKISQLIVETKASLQTAVSWTEEEVSKYAWNPNLTLSDTHSIKLRNLDSSDERLTTSPLYPFRVLLGRSGVHIPEEIYDGDPHVFHTLLWTEALDFIFNTTKGLRFIYFASVSGIFRVYPAFPWDLKVVDVFDIRYTPWYIQGSAVPKDLLIMLDTSGSMTGQSLKLANVSAQKLVMDLDENDYFAVTHFPEPDNDLPLSLVTMNQTAPPCFRSFVRATRRNKLRVFRELGNLTARGYAKFDRAFAMAIDMFNELNNSTRADRTSALCNQVLVVITDSALDFDGKTLDALKNKPEHIHVLIYALGEPVSTLQHYQSQICPYRGQYTYIPTAGAVSNMMEHYHEKSTRTLLGPEGSPLQPEVLLHGVADIFQTRQYRVCKQEEH